MAANARRAGRGADASAHVLDDRSLDHVQLDRLGWIGTLLELVGDEVGEPRQLGLDVRSRPTAAGEPRARASSQRALATT